MYVWYLCKGYVNMNFVIINILSSEKYMISYTAECLEKNQVVQ